jgi:DNA repair photolyase
MQLSQVVPSQDQPFSVTNARLAGTLRGRGALSNPANRFEGRSLEPFDDGWDTLEGLADLPPLPTTLTRDSSRSAISWNGSPDIGFDRAVNPYRGCEHGCIYCYARPTHAYLGYSAGLDFETKLVFKPDVAALLERELRRPGYVCKPIALGSNTDPYQPVERTLKLTRGVLEVLERYGHPLSIVTKSAGVLRDMDILQRLAARGLVRVFLSVTTLDAALARRMEPRAATPERRLAAIAALSQAGVPAAVLAAPMIPGLNDAELERILERAHAAGARHAGYVLLRLPHEVRAMFEAWLAEHYPARAGHVLSLIRETRGGKLNDSQFGSRFSGKGVYADLLAQRFERMVRRLGFEDRNALETRHFTVSSVGGGVGETRQGLLF